MALRDGYPLLLAALLLSNVYAAAAKCPYRAAHYTLLGQPDVTAQFVPHRKMPDITDDVFFHIRVASHHEDFWYVFDTGNGYSTIRLVSTDDPTKKNWQPPEPDGGPHRPNPDENFFGIDSNLTVRDDLPFAKNPAPAYIFLPDFGMHLWYRPAAIAGPGRYGLPRAFFKLDRCAR